MLCILRLPKWKLFTFRYFDFRMVWGAQIQQIRIQVHQFLCVSSPPHSAGPGEGLWDPAPSFESLQQPRRRRASRSKLRTRSASLASWALGYWTPNIHHFGTTGGVFGLNQKHSLRQSLYGWLQTSAKSWPVFFDLHVGLPGLNVREHCF